MIHIWEILAFLMGLAWSGLRAKRDLEEWGDVNHGLWWWMTFLYMVSVCIITRTVIPVFVYVGTFPQIINVGRGLPFFYLGDTAKWDIMMKKIVGKNAGMVIWVLSWICIVLSVILINHV